MGVLFCNGNPSIIYRRPRRRQGNHSKIMTSLAVVVKQSKNCTGKLYEISTIVTTYRYHSSLVCIYSVNALLTTSSYFASLTVTPKVSNSMWYILVCIRPVIDRTNMMSIDCWIVWSVSETQRSIFGGIMGSSPFVCWPTSDFYSI